MIGHWWSVVVVVLVSMATGLYRWIDNLLTPRGVISVPPAKVPREHSDLNEDCLRPGQMTRA